MRWRPRAAAVWAIASLAGALPVAAGIYEDTAERAEKLWSDGQKLEAVRLYGSVWALQPDDVDRQILYGERSAEVGNYRWALNFFRVAEAKVKDDPERLYRVYKGYAKTYRLSGYADRAEPYEKKAEALRKERRGPVAPTPKPTPPPYYFGYYTEEPPTAPPPRAVTPTPAPTPRQRPTPAPTPMPTTSRTGTPGGRLKKRIAVAPLDVAIQEPGAANYAAQIHAMLIAELGQSDRFVAVDSSDPGAAPSDWAGAGPPGKTKGGAHKGARLVDAQLLVRGRITEFTVSSAGRPGAGGATGARQSSIAARMTVSLYDAGTDLALGSGDVSARQATSARFLRADLAAYRWNDPNAQVSTLGYVTRELAQKAVEKIATESARVPWHATVIQGSGKEVHFNAGSREGVRVGDRFGIVNIREILTDPRTNEVLGVDKRETGTIEVTRVDDRRAIGSVLDKHGPFNPGDWVVLP